MLYMLYAKLFLIGSSLTAVSAAGAGYTSIGAGACRGNAGANDKVNSRMLKPVATEATCEAHCDAIPADGSDGICAGFSYETSASDQECILYGPGMAGSCASPNQAKTSPTTCEAVGTCNAPSTAGSEEECGTCSDASAVKAAACASIGATWTAGTWTKTGVWELAAADGAAWVGDFHHTDHVHAIAANANYVCYDKDVTDHIGKCTNGADTVDPGSGEDLCTTNFKAADTFEEASCSTAAPTADPAGDGCTWTKAPTSPTEKPAHPTVPDLSGYTFKSGACRGTSATNAADSAATKGQDRPNYMVCRLTSQD